MRSALCALALSTFLPSAALAGDLTVTVDEIENGSGSVLGALYNGESSFMNQPQAFQRFKVKAVEGHVSYVFHDVPAGKYALSVFHDANDNGKLDRNGFGVPTEGYGFSNDAQGTGGPPKWEQAVFDFDGRAKTVTVTLNY
jgi:uncharacterized protein (DUF2141 family)